MKRSRFTEAMPSVPPELVARNADRLKESLLMGFAPEKFSVDVQIEQSPEGGKLLASSPFGNHL